jgi:AraC family transcriptional regulator
METDIDNHALEAHAAEPRGIEVNIPGEAQDPVRLWIEIRSEPLPSPAFLESLAALISAQLAQQPRIGRPESASRAGLAPAKLARVLAFIEQNLGEPLRIDRLAASVHMSPFHFARLFKLATGHAPHGYLTLRRVERAKELLSKESLPLVHVASSVGFQTQGHFTEVFRRYAGLTPRHFRLKSRQELAVIAPEHVEPEGGPSAQPEGRQSWQN